MLYRRTWRLESKWRKPLRDGLNALRDQLAIIYKTEGEKYLKEVWDARNNYIEVILDRNSENLNKFIENNQKRA